jgi:hypothetical protein
LTLGPFIPPYLPWPSKIVIEALEPMLFTPPSGTDANDPAWVAHCAKRLESTMEAALRRLEAERLGKPLPPPTAVVVERAKSASADSQVFACAS